MRAGRAGLHRLLDAARVEPGLGESGLSTTGAGRAATGVVAAARAAREAGVAPDAPASAFFVPGRIEVLGKHTDYAGGRSLLAATEFGFSVVAAPAPGREVRVIDARSGEGVTLLLERAGADGGPGTATLPPSAGPRGWERYPRTVLARMLRDFPRLQALSRPGAPPDPDSGPGAVVCFHGSIPPAAGMSSSSALVVGLFLALADRWGLAAGEGYPAPGSEVLPAPVERVRLAEYLAAVETGVGTAGGSEDHTAILCARPGALLRARFAPTVLESLVRVPPGWSFALASSGVVAEKAGAARDAYNRLSDEAAQIARTWREATGGSEPHAGAILALGPGARSRLEHLLPPRQRARLEQFATESEELIPGAERALGAEALETFGQRVARSQAFAEEVLQNQVEETRALVHLARELGAPAASAFGAGFGGAVWALVRDDAADAFLKGWRARYLARFPERGPASSFLRTPAGPAAFRIG